MVDAAPVAGEASGSGDALLVAEAPSNRERGEYRWRRLVMKIQTRKRWSDWGRLQNYAKNGLPKNLDGKPTGFGKHLGRWGWREIAFEW